MSNTLIATLGGLWAMLMWGTGDWLLSRSSKKADAFEANFIFNLPSLFISAVIVAIAHKHINSFHDVWVFALTAAIFSVAFVTFIKGLATGATGIVVPASSTYPLFTLVLSAIFLSVSFRRLQILAMVIIVIGVIMLAFESRDKKISLKAQHQATILALFTALMWGIGNVFQNSVIGKEAWQNVLLFIDFPITAVALVFIILKLRSKTPEGLKRALNDRVTATAGTIYCIGSIGFYYSAVRVGSVIIPIVVSSVAPLVTASLSAAFDGERLPLLKRAGAVVAVAGILLINLK